MSKMSLEAKATIFAKLIKGDEVGDIALTEDCPRATVMRLKRELEEAQRNNTISQLVDMESELFNQIIANAQASLPAGMQESSGELIDELKASKNALDQLSTNLVSSANLINNQLRIRAASVESAGELSILTEILCSLQNAFFNKNQTQVNVQNNYGQSEGQTKYGSFISDVPADHRN